MVRSASSVTNTRQWPVTARPGRLGRHRVEGDADGPDVMGEGLAELVVGHPAEECGAAPQGGQPGRRVGGRAAGGLGGRPHGRVDGLGPFMVDQGHGSLHQIEGLEVVVGGRGQDVDEGVADGHDVEGRSARGGKVWGSLDAGSVCTARR